MKSDVAKQMKYFVLFLIGKRQDLSNYGLDIKFSLSEITSDFFDANKKEEQIKELLEGLKKDKLKEIKLSPHTAIEDYDINSEEVKVSGASVENLLIYSSKRLALKESIFGYGKDENRNDILTVLGEKTPEKISVINSYVFSCFYKNPGEVVSYEDVFKKLRESYKADDQNHWQSYERNNRAKMDYINGVVRELRKKLEKALGSIYSDGNNIEIIENQRYKGKNKEGGRYVLKL